MAEEEVINDTNTEAAQEQPQETAATEAPKTRKKKARRSVPHGQVHVLATFNNTIVSITDGKGNLLTTASAGSSGFRGSKKGTAYAAQMAAERAITNAKQSYGVSKVDVFVKGIGMGRDAAVRTLVSQNVDVESIKDVTGVPHGGVRPRRPKRN
ncbi:MAG TPA: 30S ribosomal protein S11 [Candidatus Saccharimonadales bacterium]|nr:30S ribosomal protein S11 [Candidatus Saccharimonadales bacterium]